MKDARQTEHRTAVIAVTAADRANLLRKYRLLATWRLRKDQGAVVAGMSETPPETARHELRALAQEFPGALRELDVLGLSEMSRRIGQLERPAEPAPASNAASVADAQVGDSRFQDERWMNWILAYHGLMRAALLIRHKAGATRRLSEAGLVETLVTAGASATWGVAIDESFARAVLSPPGGRMTVVVLGALANHFQESATEISRTLFPPRRGHPYALSS